MAHVRYTKKAICKNWCFGQFYHSKIEKLTLRLSQFPWLEGFFREREKTFSTYSGRVSRVQKNNLRNSWGQLLTQMQEYISTWAYEYISCFREPNSLSVLHWAVVRFDVKESSYDVN